jgi:hypothetical protein
MFEECLNMFVFSFLSYVIFIFVNVGSQLRCFKIAPFLCNG